jgi:predicted TIM-barrel fold metal-dependent hydrolase
MSSTETLAAGRTGKDVDVAIVDVDVHPMPFTLDEIRGYVREDRWRDRLFPMDGRTKYPSYAYYDPPDAYTTSAMRMDSAPPRGGMAGSDPDYAVQQLFVDAGVDIGILQPMIYAQWPDAEHAMAEAYNDWLADLWLGDHNRHGRWRGSICVSPRAPEAAAREIERWAGHEAFVQVLVSPQTFGVPFGDPSLDPLYEAAARHGLPVANHLSLLSPYEQTPYYPVGNPGHYSDFFACFPLLLISHLSSLVFDGALERHPDLKVVFVEGGFTWAAPTMWRLDRTFARRRKDLPELRRKPSEYIRDQVFWATQPLEEVETSEFRRYLEVMDLGDNILVSTDYPHWSYDAPSWAATRFPKEQRDDIMRGNAMRLYGLPTSVPALPAKVAS